LSTILLSECVVVVVVAGSNLTEWDEMLQFVLVVTDMFMAFCHSDEVLMLQLHLKDLLGCQEITLHDFWKASRVAQRICSFYYR